MKRYLQAISIWFLIIPLVIVNGWLRETILIALGKAALPLSGLLLCVCIYIVALLFIPKIKNCKPFDYIAFGVIWFMMTNLFDLFSILSDGGTIQELFQLYDVTSGNLWIAVVATAAVSPYLVYRGMKNRQV